MANNIRSNAEDYINKLYDNAQDKQKQLLTDAFSKGTEAIDTQKQEVQKQTDTNLERTNVEAQKIQQGYKPENVSDMAMQQAALTMENQQKKNTQMLRAEQQNAEVELERLRKLYADQFSAAIKKAQADNDMVRAQQLYEAAKAKESELRAFSSQMGTLDNQALIDKIYESAIESGKQDLEMDLQGKLSELYAQQEAQRRETDKELTETYVDALKNKKNFNEVQNAYGLGSGNMAQAQLARDTGLTQDLTELRRVQTLADAMIGRQQVGAEKSYADAVADLTGANEQKRAEALYREALTQQPKTAKAGGPLDGGPDPELTFADVGEAVRQMVAEGKTNGEIHDYLNKAKNAGIITSKSLSHTKEKNSETTTENQLKKLIYTFGL